MSIGFDNLTVHNCIFLSGGAVDAYFSLDKSIFISSDMSNNISAQLIAVGDDGFTLSWALTGSVIIVAIYLALP
ncbi:unnamed protein product [marine sediment metagenome]|uniref:Uncharacterized protein n=1 Tax=marine sediment metagenome TaxID=412755 RepID=X1VVR6_9ZZZZ